MCSDIVVTDVFVPDKSGVHARPAQSGTRLSCSRKIRFDCRREDKRGGVGFL